MNGATLAGIHHIALNVQDVERSVRWYGEVLGFTRFSSYDGAGFHRVILRHPACGIVLGLTRHDDPECTQPFNERRTGLDHLAMQVPDRRALDGWVSRFEAFGVLHSEVKPGAIPGSFLVAFRDPDNIQLEVFAPAQVVVADDQIPVGSVSSGGQQWQARANREIFERVMDEVFGRGNLDAVDVLFSSDFREHEEGPGKDRGQDGVKDIVQMMRTAFPDLQVGIEAISADGDRTWARVRFSGTNTGTLMGYPPTGRRASWTAIDQCRYEDGKLAEHWGVVDLLSMLQQLGQARAPGVAQPVP